MMPHGLDDLGQHWFREWFGDPNQNSKPFIQEKAFQCLLHNVSHFTLASLREWHCSASHWKSSNKVRSILLVIFIYFHKVSLFCIICYEQVLNKAEALSPISLYTNLYYNTLLCIFRYLQTCPPSSLFADILTFSYVYTRRGATSIIDATAWGRGVKYRGAVYTRRDVAMI